MHVACQPASLLYIHYVVCCFNPRRMAADASISGCESWGWRFSMYFLLRLVWVLTLGSGGGEEGKQTGGNTPYWYLITSQSITRVLWKDSFVVLLAETQPCSEARYKSTERFLIKIYLSITIDPRLPYLTLHQLDRINLLCLFFVEHHSNLICVIHCLLIACSF